MKSKVSWKDNLSFTGTCGNHSVAIDTKPPVGKDTGMSPKELVAIGIAGCSGMDVVGLLKKYKQPLTSFDIEVDVEQTENGAYPVVFKKVELTFKLQGEIDREKAKEAVMLSMTKFCGVAAMIEKICPISYVVTLNEEEIDSGKAAF